MSQHKIAGCCSICDAPCFEVLGRWDSGEKRAGEPKALGRPNDDAVRLTFLLMNGRVTDMTVCGPCADALTPEQYIELWRRNLCGYLREQDGDAAKFVDEFANGLLYELGRKPWKDVVNG